MAYNIKAFQKRYGLSNRDMAEVCGCSLPTIQKWRSGEVAVSGAAGQLMRVLDYAAEGNPRKLRELFGRLNQQVEPSAPSRDPEIEELETSMTRVVDRLELMLESRRKDRELAESEARYRSMVESSSNPVCRWLPDTTLTYVNEAYASLYSAFGENLIGRKWLDFIPEKRRPAISAIVSDLVRRGQEETMMHESIDKAGKVRYQEWRDIPVKNDQGVVVELHSVGEDVTELVRARQQMDQLRALKSVLFGLHPLPVLLFDADGNFAEMNDRFRTEIMGANNWQRLGELLPKQALSKFKRLLKRTSGAGEFVFHLRLDHGDYLLKGAPLVGDADVSRFIAVFQKLASEQGSELLMTRLQHEIVIEGKAHGFLLDPATARKLQLRMQRLGGQVNVDRIYVFTFDTAEGVFDNILEWSAEGIEPQIEGLQRVPMTEYPWWIKRLLGGSWIDVEDTSRLPRTAAREQEVLQAQGIGAVLVAPLVLGDQVVGFAGFDHNGNPRIWHEQERTALGNFSTEIAGVLARELALPGSETARQP